MIKFVILLIALCLTSSCVGRRNNSSTIESEPALTLKEKMQVLDDPFQQWLNWEVEKTKDFLHQERQTSEIVTFQVPSSHLDVEWLAQGIAPTQDDPAYLSKIQNFIGLPSDETLRWMRHPYNSDFDKVPKYGQFETDSPLKVDGFHTSSRSIVLEASDAYFSVKMPTNYPFGKSRMKQKEKAELHEDIADSLVRSRLILEMKQGYERHSPGEVLHTLGVVRTSPEHWKAKVNGFLIRDLRPILRREHYYFPAHLIATPLGETLAGGWGASQWQVFWREHWGAALGKFLAKAALVWGLAIEKPNPQNFLIQLDKETLAPTGVLAWRDIGDSNFIGPFLEEIAEKNETLRKLLSREKKLSKEREGLVLKSLGWRCNKLDFEFDQKYKQANRYRPGSSDFFTFKETCERAFAEALPRSLRESHKYQQMFSKSQMEGMNPLEKKLARQGAHQDSREVAITEDGVLAWLEWRHLNRTAAD